MVDGKATTTALQQLKHACSVSLKHKKPVVTVNLEINNVKRAIKAVCEGKEYDEEVLEAWNDSDLKQLRNDMEKPAHHLYKYTMRRAWEQLPEGEEEPQPNDEDTRVVYYLLEYINVDGIKRRLNELISKLKSYIAKLKSCIIEEGIFKPERLGYYLAFSYRIGGRHLVHAFRCLWVHLYEWMDEELPPLHKSQLPRQ